MESTKKFLFLIIVSIVFSQLCLAEVSMPGISFDRGEVYKLSVNEPIFIDQSFKNWRK